MTTTDQPESPRSTGPLAPSSDGVNGAPVDELPPAPTETDEPEGPGVHPVRLLLLTAFFLGLWFVGGPPMLVVVLAIVFMIVMHEAGHYLTARASGMKVTEYFIGFGPRIASFRRGETEYGIKAIPAGAYVRIIGMNNLDEAPIEDEGRTYRQQPFHQRLLVASAGSAMHFLMALILLFVVLTTVGISQGWSVGGVVDGSAAATAGVRPGDVIESIGSVDVSDDFGSVRGAAAEQMGQEIDIVVQRDGTTLDLPARVTRSVWVVATDGANESADFRLVEGDAGLSLYDSDLSDSRLAAAGLNSGDRIVAINGRALDSIDDVRPAIEASAASRVRFEVAGLEPVMVDLGDALAADDPVPFLGVSSAPAPLETLGAGDAAVESVRVFGRAMTMSVGGLGKVLWPPNLFGFFAETVGVERHADDPAPSSATQLTERAQDDVETRPVSIVGVVRLGSDSISSDGWSALLVMLVQLNIVIGVFNLLPLPPLDGGHIAVATYEKCRELLSRRPGRYFVDYGKLLPVTYTVVMLLIVLGSFTLLADLTNPIRL